MRPKAVTVLSHEDKGIVADNEKRYFLSIYHLSNGDLVESCVDAGIVEKCSSPFFTPQDYRLGEDFKVLLASGVAEDDARRYLTILREAK